MIENNILDDKEVYEKYGLEREDIELIAADYESGDLSGMEFTEPINGRPTAADASATATETKQRADTNG